MLERARRLAVRGFDAAAAAISLVRAAKQFPPRRGRLERFGAIVQLTVPRALGSRAAR
jgi:hypothetical protein